METGLTILITGPRAGGKTLLGNYLAAVLAAAGFKVDHDGLPVYNINGAATLSLKTIRQLGYGSGSLKIETTNEPVTVGPSPLVGTADLIRAFRVGGSAVAEDDGQDMPELATIPWSDQEVLALLTKSPAARGPAVHPLEPMSHADMVVEGIVFPKTLAGLHDWANKVNLHNLARASGEHLETASRVQREAMLAEFRKNWPEAAAFFDIAKADRLERQREKIKDLGENYGMSAKNVARMLKVGRGPDGTRLHDNKTQQMGKALVDLQKRIKAVRQAFLNFVRNHCDDTGMTPPRSLFENATDLRVKRWKKGS